jgi:hypothetical protein
MILTALTSLLFVQVYLLFENVLSPRRLLFVKAEYLLIERLLLKAEYLLIERLLHKAEYYCFSKDFRLLFKLIFHQRIWSLVHCYLKSDFIPFGFLELYFIVAGILELEK